MAAVAIPEEAKCLDSSYPLRGLADFRCPECGRVFDPKRPLTMNVGLPLAGLARVAAGPMGRLPRIAMWALLAVGVVGPGWLVPSDDLAVLWLLLWLTFFAGCWVRSFLRRLVARRRGQPKEMLRVDDRFRWKARLAFVLSVVLVLTRAPFVLAILVSRPWLDSYAFHWWAEVPAVQPLPATSVMKGAVIVRSVRASGGGVTLEFFGGEIEYVPTKDGKGLRIAWWSWNPRWYALER